MTSNLITLHVGQCGNQLGLEFWSSLCREHGIGIDGKQEIEEIRGADNKEVFFYEADDGRYVPRALLVDLEPRVINTTIKGDTYGKMFNPENLLLDEEGGGAGNKWTEGYHSGKKYAPQVLDMLRREAENADYLDGFIMTHSVNGGTGSGMGSRLLEQIRQEFPKVLVQTYSVFPSDSDVVVGPYNTVLTLSRLKLFADQVIVVDNRALNRLAALHCEKPSYTHTNQMVSQILTATTAPIRFYGSTYNKLNYQVAELNAYAGMHFNQPGYTPISLSGGKNIIIKTSAQDTLTRLLKPESMMVTTKFDGAASKSADARHCMLAGLAILQGNVSENDVIDAKMKMEQNNRFTFAPWSGGQTMSTTTCVASPYVKRGNKVSGVLLANHTSIVGMLDKIHADYRKMFDRKVYFDQFNDFVDAQLDLVDSESQLLDLRDSYYDATKADFLSSKTGGGQKQSTSGKENCAPSSLSPSEVSTSA